MIWSGPHKGEPNNDRLRIGEEDLGGKKAQRKISNNQKTENGGKEENFKSKGNKQEARRCTFGREVDRLFGKIRRKGGEWQPKGYSVGGERP